MSKEALSSTSSLSSLPILQSLSATSYNTRNSSLNNDNNDNEDPSNDMNKKTNINAIANTNTNNNVSSTGGPNIELPENSRIVQPEYLEKYTSKKDLLRRLHNLVQVLRHDESVEVDSNEWPGLGGISQYIITNFIQHKDKDIRLYAVLVCMEIFHIYAPEVPWDKQELILIFQQTVRQLGNLAHTTDPTKQPNFKHYAHILELFAQVKIGCVIVDLAQQEGSNINNDDNNDMDPENEDDSDKDEIESFDSDNEKMKTPRKSKKKVRKSILSMSTTENATPLEVVIDLIHTLLHCVRNEHPVEILELVQQAIAACLDEYNPEHGAPIPISLLDELLLCIGQGPTVLVVNAAAHQQLSVQQQSKQIKNKRNSKTNNTKYISTTTLPLHVEQTNPTFVVAAAVVRTMLNKLATPIAHLLNSLLNGDSYILEQSSIRCPTSNTNISSSNDQSPTNAAAVAFDTNLSSSENSIDVYSIVYELHRVAPQILTTVIGTVSNGLRSPDTAKRSSVTNLLGRLFSAPPPNGSSSANNNYSNNNMATKFRPCYREWLGRSVDVESSIRIIIVKFCVSILRLSPYLDTNICQEASETITKSLTNDPNLDVRLEAIHQITDWIYKQNNNNISNINNTKNNNSIITPALLRAVGNRCSSKHKQERRDAVTGLAKIYSQQYMNKKLKSVIDGGDDCHVGIIEDILNDVCHFTTISNHHHSKGKGSPNMKKSKKGSKNHSISDTGNYDDDDEDRYAWIPSKIFECLCYTDQTDSEMRNRVIQIIDEVLLGNSSSSSSVSDENSTKTNKTKMTPTSRAVGLIMIFDSIRNSNLNNNYENKCTLTSDRIYNSSTTNAFKFLQQLLIRRSKLQQIISNYIDARAAIREFKAGTEEAMAAEAKAMELLEVAASLTSPIATNISSAPTIEDVLTSFHGARDKHIFRILAAIANPNHTMQARIRALDELPKRTKSLGNGVSDWIRDLVKRCSMSDFLNAEIINHCVLLAQECFKQDNVPCTAVMLSCVKTAVEIFPSLGATDETFVTLTELFADCRQESKADIKNELEAYDVITSLSSILSLASTAKPKIVGKDISNAHVDELQTHLMKLCTHDGTPEQARNAVYTLSQLLTSSAKSSDDASISSSTKSSQSSNHEPNDEVLSNIFTPLIKALTSSTRLKISVGDDKTGSSRIISTLSALSALSDCAPLVMASSNKGIKALKFALEIVVMGRDQSSIEDENMDDDESTDNDTLNETPSSSRKKRRSSLMSPEKNNDNCSPGAKHNILENETLSIQCRRACAAIDFLVSHVRATILLKIRRNKLLLEHVKSSTVFPSEAEIQSVFQLLTQILRDKGLPPSNRDRRHCKARHERAALRQCAATHLLRLSDGRLGLEKKYLSPSMWHLLSESFLDEEHVVRIAIMDEFSSLLIGSGIYGLDGSRLPPKSPSLRFLSMITLCSDGDHGSDNDMANGSAANVGKISLSTKNAAFQCIVNLRKVVEASYTHCKAMGKEAENKFETQFKMLLMPEYSVPYALHLLSHRRETPSAGGTALAHDDIATLQEGVVDEEDGPVVLNDESQQRVLRKRLKILFEPLIQSLGDEADNISFLLRMTEILGKHYKPVDTMPNALLLPSSKQRLSIDSGSTTTQDLVIGSSDDFAKSQARRSDILEAKLKTICAAARDVLLSFVKKDVNLSSYPGTIQLPSTLFARTDRGSVSILPSNYIKHSRSESLSPGLSVESLQKKLKSRGKKPSVPNSKSAPKRSPPKRATTQVKIKLVPTRNKSLSTSSPASSPATGRSTRSKTLNSQDESAEESKIENKTPTRTQNKIKVVATRNKISSTSLPTSSSKSPSARSTLSKTFNSQDESVEESIAENKTPIRTQSKFKVVATRNEVSSTSPHTSLSPSGRSTRSKMMTLNSQEEVIEVSMIDKKTPSAESNDGSSRKTRVHFSPEVIDTRKSNQEIFSDSNSNSSFGGLSPIAKSVSPTYPSSSGKKIMNRNEVDYSVSPETLGTTPPSALRSHTMTLHDQENESDDLDLSPQFSSIKPPESPLVRREALHSLGLYTDDNDGNKASESSAVTQESKESSNASKNKVNKSKRSASTIGELSKQKMSKVTKRGKSTSMPHQIKLNRSKSPAQSIGNVRQLMNAKSDNKKKTKICKFDDFDFDEDENMEENRPVAKNQAITTKKVKSSNQERSQRPTRKQGIRG